MSEAPFYERRHAAQQRRLVDRREADELRQAMHNLTALRCAAGEAIDTLKYWRESGDPDQLRAAIGAAICQLERVRWPSATA